MLPCPVNPFDLVLISVELTFLCDLCKIMIYFVTFVLPLKAVFFLTLRKTGRLAMGHHGSGFMSHWWGEGGRKHRKVR